MVILMKVLVSGKGGCGKSTISAMLGKYLAADLFPS